MENTSIKQNLENLSKIDTLSCGSALHLAKLDDQIGKKVALGAKLKICAVLQKPQPHWKNLQEEHTSQMQHRLKKTVGVMGVATGEDETEIHPEFPQREAEYTAPTTSDHGKSSYGWHHGNKHLANAKGLRSGRALLRNPQLPCCQGEQISE